ncbi:hypothetical protein B0T22DRAFT_283175 [Podospora appendiculata]|uniref:Signal transduction histidine-protein kinase n=1 Tax=Podospora appendiculata TaxID=314037 RepID=A0AAE1C854_9PEZI|nr:hypothetical protein B0T22DRAFT_283175 [Podospora appendiculata]
MEPYPNNDAPPGEPQPPRRDSSSHAASSDGDDHHGIPPRSASTRSIAPSPTGWSSWSHSSDRQLSYGNSHGSSQQQHDFSDRVFPVRSVVSVTPTHTPAYMGRISGEHRHAARRLSLSEGCAGAVQGTSATSRTDTAATAIACPQSSPKVARVDVHRHDTRHVSSSMSDYPPSPRVTSPPMKNVRQRRTMEGPLSSIQADAERQGNAQPVTLNLVDSSSEGSENGGDMDTQTRGNSSRGRSPSDTDPESFYTVRFKHVMTDGGHAVITGRDGMLQRCEDEPIHTPGAIQSFGLMIAIQEEPDGRFQVRYASENSKRLIGYAPQDLFRLSNFMDILTEEQAENLLDHIDFIGDEDSDPATAGPEVFSLSIRSPGDRRSAKLWCAIHIHPDRPELIICEFEMDDDIRYPLRPVEEDSFSGPEDTLHSNPTSEELTESTEIMSKPLRVLRSARKKRGEAGAMQVFDIMSQVQEQLANAPNLERFLKILVGIIKELTGFHRVMIYQFDSSFNGKVVTELVDPTQTRDLYKGLHFPAADIPKQARDLYKLNKVRLLYDRDLETARIVCRTIEELERPLDLTHSYLRAISPIHLKYLANMAVRSSMSISINAFNDLWGLIACHSYGPKGMRVSFPIRKMCRLVGETVSRNIERLSYASRLQARKLINTIPTDKNPSGYIIASSDDLLRLFDADFGMLSIREEIKILGRCEQSQEPLALLEYLRLRRFTSVVMSQDIGTDFPELRYAPGFSVIAGLLYVPLSVGGNDFIVFFRKGQIREVRWAGNPYEKIIREGTSAYLEPRKSFKVWNETVVGKSREWSEEQVETAAVLCLVYGKFIEVWRQKEAALHNSRLTRLLLANSAHEVRTPLNAIINYLEIALEGSLDQETRDNLARSHSASKSLIYVINDLLDLTKTEEGQELIKDEIFDFLACVREATEQFENDARRKGLAYQVVEHPGLPRHVYGDQRRVRQAIANITANAVEHTLKGSVKVELYVAEVQGRKVWVEVVVQDTGKGMSKSQLDDLFADLEQVNLDEDVFTDSEEANGKPRDARTLGLGLAVVARILRNMDGQLRLKSEEGVGSRFVIQLPFELPPDDSDRDVASGTAIAKASSAASITASLPTSHAGEVLLVDCGSISSGNHHTSGLSARRSFDETQSIKSHRTVASRGSTRSGMSAKSDAERLIDAIQTPLTLGEPEPEDISRQRQASHGAYYHRASVDTVREHAARSVSPTNRGRRPGPPSRSASSPNYKKVAEKTPPSGQHSVHRSEPVGVQYITDVRVPIKPVRIPDETYDQPQLPQQSETSRVLFEITDKRPQNGTTGELPTTEKPKAVPAKLHVLIAEDDPINVKVLRKRLEKAGHYVFHAMNGQDCATMYEEKPTAFDVILMDMQMPIVDGLTSTKMIRALEQSDRLSGLSMIALDHGRIPIIAVSASLLEREKDTYVDAGFDGWILKPIDFKRLETLLQGIVDDSIRDDLLYVPGQWERGGFFGGRQGQDVSQQAKSVDPRRDETIPLGHAQTASVS